MSQCVLVTGGSRGLGLAIVKRLAADGFHVLAASRRISAELSAAIDAAPGNIEHLILDLHDSDGFQQFCQAIYHRYGALYGLVNNAALGHDGVLATQHDRQISELIQVNVTSTILLTKYATRLMLPQREGRIVNISSIIASTGYSGLAAYAASKAAMLGLTRSLARELGRAGITVNAVAPGYMVTDMTAGIDDNNLKTIKRRSPLNRLVSVDEVAGSVAYLLGPDAASITGTTLTVDAGSTA